MLSNSRLRRFYQLCIFVFLLNSSQAKSLNDTEVLQITRPPDVSESLDRDITKNILSSLLNIELSEFDYIDKQGIKRHDSLKQFKALERHYMNLLAAHDQKGQYNKMQLKLIMLMAFYAHERNSGAFKEYLASDLMPVYRTNTHAFLAILAELPYLIEANCSRLNAFFGFEGKNLNTKPAFLAQYSQLIKTQLTEEHALLCLSQFK